MTCRSCHHSHSILGQFRPVLWCRHHDMPAKALCERFVYEPGTDEP